MSPRIINLFQNVVTKFFPKYYVMDRGAPQYHENKDSRPKIFWLIGHNWSPKITFFEVTKEYDEENEIHTCIQTNRQANLSEIVFKIR